jgi:PAS domain-containing protein
LGMAPASDVEPILEAFSDGAEAVGTDGRILYANHALADLTSIHPGDTLQEVLDRCQMRTFGGASLEIDDIPDPGCSHRREGRVDPRTHAPARRSTTPGAHVPRRVLPHNGIQVCSNRCR